MAGLDVLGGSSSQLFGILSLLGLIMVPIAIFVFVLLLVVKFGFFRRYPVQITVYEQRSDGRVEELIDKGRRVVDKSGQVWYEFKKRARLGRAGWIKAPDFRYIQPRRRLWLFSPAPNEFHPIEMKMGNPEPYFEPVRDSAIATVQAMRLEKNVLKYMKPSFWQTYGGMMVLIIGIIVLGVIGLIQYQTIGSASSGFSAVADKLGLFTDRLAQLTVKLGAPVVQTPPA